MEGVQRTSPMRTISCKRCGASFTLPEIPADVRSRVAEWVRSGSRIQAIKLLHLRTGIEIADCKGIGFHITQTKGICHRCKRPLESSGEVICGKCNSLNLDW